MKEKKNYNYRVRFSALSAASYLAKGGRVVYEKMLLLVEEQDN
jgi:hypothetical protein